MTEWRTDMENAPRDGSWIWAWDGKCSQPLCWVQKGSYFENYEGWAYADSRWGGVLHEGWNEFDGEIVKWMPLPSTPDLSPNTGDRVE